MTMAACATTAPPSPLPLPPQQATLFIPPECALDPVAPVAVAKPSLPPIPAPADPTYLPLRTKASELVALTAIAQRDAIKDAYETNVRPQRVCTEWAKKAQQ